MITNLGLQVCFTLFYSVLLCFTLIYSVLLCFTLFYSVLLCNTLPKLSKVEVNINSNITYLAALNYKILA